MYGINFKVYLLPRSVLWCPQVLAYDTESSPFGWGSSRGLFAETADDKSEVRRFVALDYRGGVTKGEGAPAQRVPGWSLGVGYDGNGALGLEQSVELSRWVKFKLYLRREFVSGRRLLEPWPYCCGGTCWLRCRLDLFCCHGHTYSSGQLTVVFVAK